MRISGDQSIEHTSTNSHQDRLIEVLVEKLVGRLPHRSDDYRFTTLETDDYGIRKTVQSLQELCRHRLPYVIHLLQAELELVIKTPTTKQYRQTPSSQYNEAGASYTTLDNLRSQMFITQIMASCLNWYWDCFRQAESEQTKSIPADLPPLDDKTAKQLLATVAFLLKQDMVHSGSSEGPRYTGASASPGQASLRSFGNDRLGTPSTFARSRQSTAQSRASNTRSPTFVTVENQNTPTIMRNILDSAASIAAFISASRWDVMLVKLRNLLNYYSSSEEYPDLSEIGLFEYCSLNEYRFSSMMGELSMFSNLQRSAQAILCTILYRAIWKFLFANPHIMATMYEDQRRMSFSGQPEALFDSVFAISDSSKRKAHTWPLLAILIPFCPEIVTKIVMTSGGVDARSPMFAKKLQFLDGLRKAVRSPSNGSKGSDLNLALMCYADLCRAASFTPNNSGRQQTGLRILVSDMEMEIRTRVLDLAHPVTLADGNVDTDLMTQALVALSKIHFSHVKSDILPRLLAKPGNPQFQKVALEACTILLREGQLLPWHMSALDITSTISIPVRQLLQETTTSSFATDDAGRRFMPPNSRSRQSLDDEQSPRNQTLMRLLALIAAEPGLLFLRNALDTFNPQTPRINNETFSAQQLLHFDPSNAAQSIALICCLTDEHNPFFIRHAATSLLLQLQYYSAAQPDDPFHRYHNAASAVSACEVPLVAAFAWGILQLQPDAGQHKLALQVATTWLNHLVHAHSSIEKPPSEAQAIISILELAGLVSLCSTDEEVRQATTPFFQALQKLAKRRNVLDTNVAAIALTLSSEHSPGIAGVIAHAKRLLRVFKAVTEPSAGLRAAWLENHRRWAGMAGKFGVAGYDEENQKQDQHLVGLDVSVLRPAPVTEEDIMQWIHLSGFLIQTLDCYTRASTQNDLAGPLAGHLSPRFFEDKAPQRLATHWLKHMTNLLWSEYPRMRDATRELLGNDLGTGFLPSLVGQFHQAAELYVEYGRFETASEEVTLFFDQSFGVLSQMLARIPEAQELSPPVVQQLESLFLANAYYTNRQESSAVSARLKMQLCRSAQALFTGPTTRRAILSSSFRNVLAEYLLACAEEAVSGEHEKSHQELQTQAVQALALCFDGMVARRVSEKPLNKSESPDIRLVTGYVDRLLAMTGSAVNTEPQSLTLDRKISADSRLQAEAARNTPESVLIGITEAVANLLLANLPTSCARIIELAASPSTRMNRNAMASVMRKWPSDVQPVLPMPDLYSDLIAAICAPDLEVALAIVEICPGSEQEGLLELLMSLLASRGLATKLLKAIVTKEINDTEHESTLFRGNTVASRLLTVFARSTGHSYTRFLVSNLMSNLTMHPLGLSDFDIYQEADPEDEGLLKLEALAEAFFGLICDTWFYIPAEIRDICHHIQAVVRNKFPDSVYTAIGGWIFLRFINPAIISPDLVDVELPEESKEIRRALVLITKLLQALSNNIRFKEAGMKTLNAFVEKHILDMTAFLGQISASDIPANVDDSTAVDLSYFAQRTLFHFIWSNTERIGSILLTRSAGDLPKHLPNGSARSSFDVPNTNWAQLTDILWKIRQEGETVEDRRSLIRPTLLLDLVRTEPAQGDLVNVWAAVLKTGFFARDGSPAMCLVFHSLNTQTTDFDSIMRYGQYVLNNISGPFDLVLDCWAFEDENAIPHEWLRVFAAVLPEDAAASLRKIYIYSPSTALVRYIRALASVLPLSTLDKKIKILYDVNELQDHFPSPAAVLSPRSIMMTSRDLESAGTAIFSPEDSHPCPSKVYTGAGTLQIQLSKKRPLIGDIKCTTRDIIWLDQIDAIRLKHTLYASRDLEVLLRSERRLDLLELDEPSTIVAIAEARIGSAASSHDLHGALIARSKSSLVAVLLSSAVWQCVSNLAEERDSGFSLISSILRSFALVPTEQIMPGIASAIPATVASLPDLMDQISEKQLDLTGVFLLSLLQHCQSGTTLEVLRIIPFIKPWISNLSAYAYGDDAAAEQQVRAILHMLVILSMQDEIHRLLQSKAWPTLIKAEGLLDRLLSEVCNTLTRCDISPRQKELVAGIFNSGGSGTAIHGRCIAHIRQLVDTAAVAGATSLEQTEQWLHIQALLQIDTAIATATAKVDQIYAAEIVIVIVFLAGLGSEEERMHLDNMAASHLHQIPSGSSSMRQETEQAKVRNLLKALGQLARILGPEVSGDDQDKEARSAVECIDEVAGTLVRSLESGAPNEDALNAWKARCASLISGYIGESDPLLQTRSLLVLSHLDMDIPTISVLMRTLQVNLEENMNSNALQAYLLCFTRFLQGASSADLAGQLFWLGIGTSQAHPLLFSLSIDLLEASIRCIAKHGSTSDDGLHIFLLKVRQGSDQLQAASFKLDQAIEAEITASNFSFAMAVLLAKGLRQPPTMTRTANLFKTLAVLSIDGSPPLTNGHGEHGEHGEHSQTLLANLGYIVSLLAAAAGPSTDIRTQDVLQIAGIEATQIADPLLSYQPLLADVDFEKNEPLVLAASLAMSLLRTAESNQERIILIRFLHEIADLSASVVLLLENHIMPSLSLWLKTSDDSDLISAAHDLLGSLLSSTPDVNHSNLDISTYITALGFPNLLECTSYANFVDGVQASPEQTRYKLRCCADLLSAFAHVSGEKSVNSS